MSVDQIQIAQDDTPNEILDKLRLALRADGDFPVRAKVVTELRQLVSDPRTTMGQITEVILREPSLGTRVLSLVNSAFYQGVQPIMTITQAVARIGMQALSELCAGFVLMQKFGPAAKRGGAFSDSLKKSITMALTTSYLVRLEAEGGVKERGYLAGTFFNLGELLLAYYFPQVYEAAGRRAESRNHDVIQSLTEILGVSPMELSLSIVDALKIPDYYCEVMVEAHKSFEERSKDHEHFIMANALATAEIFSSSLIRCDNKEQLLKELDKISAISGYEVEQLLNLISILPQIFKEHCELIELNFLTLPDYVVNFDNAPEVEEVTATPSNGDSPIMNDEVRRFNNYTAEIKEAIQDQEPISSIITSVMETLAFGLSFDRVLLLLLNDEESELLGRMCLGSSLRVDPKSIKRFLNAPDLMNAPDVAAVKERTVKVFGEPIFHDGWPFAAIPIGGSMNEPIGVIYADRCSSPDDDVPPLDNRTQASLSILADLLDQAVSSSH